MRPALYVKTLLLLQTTLMQPSLFIDDVYLSDNVRMDDLLIA